MNIRKAMAGMIAVLGIGVLGMGVQPAQASLAPDNPIETGSGPFTFTYSANTSASEAVQNGDFLTISGLNGYIPGTATSAGFAATAVGANPTAVTFTRTGGTVTGANTFSFVIQSTVGSISNVNYAFSDHSVLNGSTLVGSGVIQGPVGSPAPVPEPAMVAPFTLAGLGLLALIVRTRKSRRIGSLTA